MGRAMTLGLLKAGYIVMATDRHVDGLKEVDELAKAAGDADRLMSLAIDLTSENACDSVVEKMLASQGRIDILINNVGLGKGVRWPENWRNPIKVWQIPFEDWRLFFDVNNFIAFQFIRLCVPLMRERGWGRVISVTTSLSSMLRGGAAPYGPSKAATESMTSCLANDLGNCGVTANVLVPGGVTDTNFIPPSTPYKREDMLRPEIMVAPLLWLVSDAGVNCNATRVVANKWDTSIPPDEAFKLASAKIGWSTAGSEALHPKRIQ